MVLWFFSATHRRQNISPLHASEVWLGRAPGPNYLLSSTLRCQRGPDEPASAALPRYIHTHRITLTSHCLYLYSLTCAWGPAHAFLLPEFFKCTLTQNELKRVYISCSKRKPPPLPSPSCVIYSKSSLRKPQRDS